MNWAFKRQIIYFLIFLVVVILLGFWIVMPYVNKAPSCFDNRQNGTETGIDCGGSCVKACIDQTDDVNVLWARTFKVVTGRYNAVAYLKNSNQNKAVYKVRYRFRFADKDNVYVGSREGVTFVPPTGNFVVFEPAIDVGNSIPIYTTFEFVEPLAWSQVPKQTVDQLKIYTTNLNLINEDSSPALSATVKNGSLFRIPGVSFMAILYDAMGNAISASKTYVDTLMPEETKTINYTWPEKFDSKVVSKEIIPMYNIFLIKL